MPSQPTFPGAASKDSSSVLNANRGRKGFAIEPSLLSFRVDLLLTAIRLLGEPGAPVIVKLELAELETITNQGERSPGWLSTEHNRIFSSAPVRHRASGLEHQSYHKILTR